MSGSDGIIGRRQLVKQSAAMASLLVVGSSTAGRGALVEAQPQSASHEWLVNVVNHGAKGDGSTDDSGAIKAAAAAVVAAGGVLFFPPAGGSYRIAQDVRLPDTVATLFAPGARVYVEADTTFSLGGPLAALPMTIVTGPGEFQLERVMDVLPEWFGARADGSTDTGAALTRAAESAAARSTIMLSGGTYQFSSGVRMPAHKSLAVEGSGPGTLLRMQSGFGSDSALFAFIGTSASRTVDQALRKLRIEGTGRTSDGIALAIDYGTNIRIEDVQLYGIGNSALDIRRSWDITLNGLRVFACGGGPGGPAAVYIGDPRGSAGFDNNNTITIRSTDVERSFGVGLLLETVSNVTAVGCKFHGRPVTDTRWQESQELLLLRNARLVRMTGCEFSQARTKETSGAIRVTGGWSSLALTSATFAEIGDDDTFTIYVDCTDPRAQVVGDALVLNDPRTHTRYMHVAEPLPSSALQLGTIAAMSPAMLR
jgi:hypothetical protein